MTYASILKDYEVVKAELEKVESEITRLWDVAYVPLPDLSEKRTRLLEQKRDLEARLKK